MAKRNPNGLRQQCAYCANTVRRCDAKTCADPVCRLKYRDDYMRRRYVKQKAEGTWVRKVRTVSAACAGCGNQFDKTIHRPKFCSQACYHAHRKATTAPKIPKGKWVCGICIICSEPFVSRYKDITCSTECQRLNKAYRRRDRDFNRRARKSAAFVQTVRSVEVFEWDGYRCHLCGRMTDRTKAVPHPKAPTVDHLVPLAAGGTHEPMNCRTACFLCNVVKQNQGGGEQHVLFA